jgi:hypothetical protein
MRKIRRIYETTQEIDFLSPQKEFSLYWNSFHKSELGLIYQSIPWHELAKRLKIRDNKNGPDRMFSPQGMLALMFLKSYVGCSDRKLISYLNGNIDFQMFCGIFSGPDRISNYKIVSEISCALAKRLDIKSL